MAHCRDEVRRVCIKFSLWVGMNDMFEFYVNDTAIFDLTKKYDFNVFFIVLNFI